jgi:hypothetical protein
MSASRRSRVRRRHPRSVQAERTRTPEGGESVAVSPKRGMSHPVEGRQMRSASRRARQATAVITVALLALLVAAAVARGSVTPTRGGPATTFTAVFAPERELGVTLSLSGPRGSRCRRLETFVVPGAAASRGQFSFGPRTPGARPHRRGGRKLRAWCRGRYRGEVEAGREFELPTRVLGRVRFRVW